MRFAWFRTVLRFLHGDIHGNENGKVSQDCGLILVEYESETEKVRGVRSRIKSDCRFCQMSLYNLPTLERSLGDGGMNNSRNELQRTERSRIATSDRFRHLIAVKKVFIIPASGLTIFSDRWGDGRIGPCPCIFLRPWRHSR